MATKYGANRTLANTGTGQNIIEPGKCLGRLRVMTDTYIADGVADLLAGDTIEMGVPLPIGAQVLDVVLINEIIGGDVTVRVGDAESSARYIPTTAVHTTAFLTRIVAAEAASLPYKVDMSTAVSASTPDNQILITVVAGTSNTTLTKMIVMVFYSQD